MDQPRERIFNVPGVVLALVALMALIHLWMAFGLTVAETNDLLRSVAFSPLRYVSGVPDRILPNGLGPRIWTFVSYAFVHLNLNHLVFNLLWLVAFGAPVARRFGAARFLLFFLAAAAAGALAHLAVYWGDVSPMIGASAAVSGAMGAAMRFVFQRGGPLGLIGRSDDASYRIPAAPLTAMLRDPRALAFLAAWFGVNLLFGLGSFTMPGLAGAALAWEAHIGGFLAGLLGFRLFDPVEVADLPADADTPSVDPGDKTLNQ